jgi:hypothetical protein
MEWMGSEASYSEEFIHLESLRGLRTTGQGRIQGDKAKGKDRGEEDNKQSTCGDKESKND